MELIEIARYLDNAAMKATAVPQIAEEQNLSLKDAYNVQRISKSLRLNRGEKLVGYKLGFTSRAKMEQMGVHDLIWGFLTNTMEVQPDATIDLSNYVHPRVELEIAFRIAKTINKPLRLEEVKDYIDGVAAALEVIDSRYENFKFSLEDVVADNCSSTGFVIGDWQDVQTDISDLKMDLIIDDELVATGSSNAILGNPLESMVEISRLVSEAGLTLEPGMVIMAGAATAAKFLKPGNNVSTHVEQLGSIGFKINE